MIDLSELGGLLDLPVPATVGSDLPFRLDCEGTPVTLQGRVVRSVPWYDVHARVTWVEPNSYRVAVEFFDVADQSAVALRDLVHRAKDTNG